MLCDLFCGIGSIGLSMAKDCGRLVGIEIIEDAVRCAEDNARQNGIENAEFFAGDASDAERFFGSVSTPDGSPFSPDVILLDPPRKGCTPTLIEYIAKTLKTDSNARNKHGVNSQRFHQLTASEVSGGAAEGVGCGNKSLALNHVVR